MPGTGPTLPGTTWAVKSALKPAVEPTMEPVVKSALKPAVEPALEPALEPDDILVLRRGPGANCSSVGSAVDVLFLSAVVAGAALVAVAASVRPRRAQSVEEEEGSGSMHEAASGSTRARVEAVKAEEDAQERQARHSQREGQGGGDAGEG